jgi:hypothetical protein
VSTAAVGILLNGRELRFGGQEMKKKVLFVMAVVMVVCVMNVNAATNAYWRFEEGPAGANVPHGGQPDGVFYPGTADSSGNGNALSVWTEGWAGYAYRATAAGSTANGAANNFSVVNTGGYPAMFTDSAAMRTMSPAAFTVEASFRLENGGYKTIVGRDSRGTATINGDLAALYFQAVPNNGLAIKFCDVSGVWHEAVAANNSYVGYDWGSNPTGMNTPWYSMAGVSDGTTLSLYLRNISSGGLWQLIAQTDMTGSSANTALTAGAGSGGDWTAGNWSVGRGLYAGGHGDRAYGYIDEVRISDAALGVGDFLMVTPEPATMILLGLGAVSMLRKRK